MLQAEADQESGKTSKLVDYFPLFLEAKFSKGKVLEQAYNMWFSLKDYSYDSDCDLFLRILQGKMDEEVYVDQMNMLENLQNTFFKADEDIHGGTAKRILSKELLKSIFLDFFPVKSDKECGTCFKKLDKEYPGEEVTYLVFGPIETPFHPF